MTDLVLGTAQFGSAYGVTNTLGRLGDEEVRSIIARASEAGVTTFDTAADYGDSQLRLGQFAPAGSRFVTKFSMPGGRIDIDSDVLFQRATRTLGVSKLAGVLFHRLADLVDPRCGAAVEILEQAREDGVVERIGVSIYDADDLQLALRVFPRLDLIQLPGNIIDHELLDSSAVAELRSRGVQIHVRSAYLQGVLLSDPSTLPVHLSALSPALSAISDLASSLGTSVITVLLAFLRDHPSVDGVVIGAAHVDEIDATLEAWATPLPRLEINDIDVPAGVLDPRSWPSP